MRANNQDHSLSHDDTNGNSTYSGMADALKLIGKRPAGDTVSQLKAETALEAKPAKKRGPRKESTNNDELSDSDEDDFSDDDQFGDDGQKRERR